MLLGKALLVAALAFLAVAPCSAQPWEPSALIVWMDDSRQEAFFVPQSMLPQASTALGGSLDRRVIPMRSSPLRSLELWVDRVQKQRLKGFSGDCIEWGLDSHTENPSRNRLSLIDFAAGFPATFTGKVLSKEAGLIDAGSIRVGHRVEVEVREIVHDTSGLLAPGEVVNFVQIGGTVHVAGIPLCMDPRGGIDFQPGQIALVVAYPQRYSRTTWLGGLTFLVESGVVNPDLGYRPIVERGLTVGLLRDSIRARRGQ
jgi:hypothetical protein